MEHGNDDQPMPAGLGGFPDAAGLAQGGQMPAGLGAYPDAAGMPQQGQVPYFAGGQQAVPEQAPPQGMPPGNTDAVLQDHNAKINETHHTVQQLQQELHNLRMQGSRVKPKWGIPQCFEGKWKSGSVQPIIFLQSMQHYFVSCGVESEVEKIRLAGTYLRGHALTWFLNQWMPVNPNSDWQKFRTDFIAQYHPIEGSRFSRFRLAKEKQAGQPLQSYRDSFLTSLAICPPTMTDEEKTTQYILGLDPEIRKWIVLQNPTNLDQAIALSLQYDTAEQESRRFNKSRPNQPKPQYRQGNWGNRWGGGGNRWGKGYGRGGQPRNGGGGGGGQAYYGPAPMELGLRQGPVAEGYGSDEEEPHYQRMECSLNTDCYRCGGKGHMQPDCPSPAAVEQFRKGQKGRQWAPKGSGRPKGRRGGQNRGRNERGQFVPQRREMRVPRPPEAEAEDSASQGYKSGSDSERSSGDGSHHHRGGRSRN